MNTERFSFQNKAELFDRVPSMHDCSFTVSYENNTLALIYDHLEQYHGPSLDSPWFRNFKTVTIRYHGINGLNLTLKFGKKEKVFFDTVSPLENKELIMFRYAVDSFDTMTLFFTVFIKKKMWGGTIEMSPSDIEYIWE